MDISTQIKEKIISLDSALKTTHPTMPGLLREIWQVLNANPDQVTLLEEGEIGVIVNGLKQQTKTEIATAALKSSKKSSKNLTIADL